MNFVIIFSIFTFFLVLSGEFHGISFLSIFPVLVVQTIFSIGLGIILGIFNVFFRDTGHLFSIFLQFWFWLTPIVYPISVLPESLRAVVYFNPMYPIVGAYQTILVNGQCPHWLSILPTATIGVFLCFFGMRVFRRRSSEMVDEL